MKYKLLLSTGMMMALLSCKKKDNVAPPEPQTPKLSLVAEIGSPGTQMNEFNFQGNNALPSVGLATDGTYIYVTDKGNNCVKKIDLSTNTIIGWFGFLKGVWGYYDKNNTPDPTFEADDLIFKNNALYVMVDRWDQTSTWENRFFKINTTNNTIIDSSQAIIEFFPFSFDVDENENIYAYVKDSIKKYKNGFINGFGGYGSSNGKMNNKSHSNSHLKIFNQEIIVSDPGNNRFQKFALDGTHIESFSTAGSTFGFFNVSATGYSYIRLSFYIEYNKQQNTESSWDGVAHNVSSYGASFLTLGDKVIVLNNDDQKVYVYKKS